MFERVAEKHGLQLITESAPKGIFFESLVHFGPPGRDFRWCCKTNKLGPTTRAIMKHYPNGVLSFIGQRRYESEQRSEKPRVWRNPWTPGQVGASPIQDWTALHVWLYIFSKGEEYNPWYDRGLDRIGCFLCPASDLSEMELVRNSSKCFDEWSAYLEKHASESDLPDSWRTYALWRWKLLPDSIQEGIGADRGEGRRQPILPRQGGRAAIAALAGGLLALHHGIQRGGRVQPSDRPSSAPPRS